jgi:hypothetical protein
LLRMPKETEAVVVAWDLLLVEEVGLFSVVKV